jgi:hypothetical protein
MIGRLLTLVCGGATIKPDFEHTGPSAPLFIGRGGRLTTMSAWGQSCRFEHAATLSD